MSVIPDMIQPIEGWKTWSLVGDKLESPSFPLVWEPGEPAHAVCAGGNSEWDW